MANPNPDPDPNTNPDPNPNPDPDPNPETCIHNILNLSEQIYQHVKLLTVTMVPW